MRDMSEKTFDNLGEAYFEDWFRRLLLKEGINYLPPGTVKGLDYVISRELILLEIEDTAFEIYNAIRQIKNVLPILSSLNIGFAVAVPFPEHLEILLVTSAKFFNDFRKYNKKELWVLRTNLLLRIRSSEFIGFGVSFKHIREVAIPINLRNNEFTKETAIEMESHLRKFSDIQNL